MKTPLLDARLLVRPPESTRRSLRRFARVLAGAPLPDAVLAAKAHSTHAKNDAFLDLGALAPAARLKLDKIVGLDLKLYAHGVKLFDEWQG